MKKLAFFSILLTVYSLANATVFEVGSSKTYTKPSQVMNLVQDNDTVLIQAGLYKADVGVWTKNNLVIKGVNGFAHLQADGAYAQGKAIWVIQGNDVSIENIEFSDCKVPDHNGAGIRQEGENLKVSHCYFHDNENGILAGDNAQSEIIIEFCEFNNNGYGDGYTHNLYINHIQRLVFKFNYSHHCNEGHNLKSRAYVNEILYNFFSDARDGHSSMLVDLPNGGFSVVMGNILFQGENATNKNMLTYGLEGLTNPSQTLMAVNNTFVNERHTGAFIVVGTGAQGFAANNIFAGIGDTITGQFTGYTNIAYPNIQDAGFVSPQNFDYHLLSSSTAINKGTDFSYISSYQLNPELSYNHPADSVSRKLKGIIDLGAFEYENAISIYKPKQLPSFVYFAETKIINVIGLNNEDILLIVIDITGKELFEKKVCEECQEEIDLNCLKPGTYITNLISKNSVFSKKIIIN